MAGSTVRDIFNAVCLTVKRSFLQSCDIVNVKSKTMNSEDSEEENLKKTITVEPQTTIALNTKDISGTVVETVKESVERVDEQTAMADIEREIEEKFPYALGSVCGNLAELDKLYRKAHGREEQVEFSQYFIDVENEFPLCDVFVHPCVMFISSMMLIDVNEKRSDVFYDRYASAVSKIAHEIPPEIKSTVEKYPF